VADVRVFVRESAGADLARNSVEVNVAAPNACDVFFLGFVFVLELGLSFDLVRSNFGSTQS
jgi:hypothetical protein